MSLKPTTRAIGLFLTGVRAPSPFWVEVPPQEVLKGVDLIADEATVDEMAFKSYGHSNFLARELFFSRLHSALNLLRPRKHERILDFGTGSGVLLPSLSASAAEICATDLVTEAARAIVRNRKLHNVWIEDSETVLSGACGRFNGIVALDVLEHVHDLDHVLRALRDLLHPEGRLIISGPTENLFYKLGRVVAGFSGKGGYHKSTIYVIQRAAEELGLKKSVCIALPRFPFPRLFLVMSCVR